MLIEFQLPAHPEKKVEYGLTIRGTSWQPLPHEFRGSSFPGSRSMIITVFYNCRGKQSLTLRGLRFV